MNSIQTFNNSQFGDIRVTTDESENPIFCLIDLCRILSLDNVSKVKSRLNQKGITISATLTPGGTQKLLYVNESNLYKVVFQSRKPEAEKFTEWVTGEVLPTIRKHGGYLTLKKIEEVLADPDTIIRLATDLKKTREEKAELEVQTKKQALALEEAVPKLLFADSVVASKQSVLVRDLAKIIRQNGVHIGQNRLFDWLRMHHYLCQWGESYNQPTQKAMEMGLFEIKKNVMNQPDGTIFVTETTKVTPKGQIYFVNKFLNGANT